MRANTSVDDHQCGFAVLGNYHRFTAFGKLFDDLSRVALEITDGLASKWHDKNVER